MRAHKQVKSYFWGLLWEPMSNRASEGVRSFTNSKLKISYDGRYQLLLMLSETFDEET